MDPSKRQSSHVKALLPFNSEQTALDDATLDAIKSVLTSNQMRLSLVEEEVATRAFKVSQYASERTRYRENMWEGTDFSYDHAIFDDVYKEEEEYALGNEFYKMVIAESSHALSAVGKNVRSSGSGSGSCSGSGNAGSSLVRRQLEPRTVKWLKKATGLQKPHDPLDHKSQDMSNDEDIGLINKSSGNQRRLTRGMVRSTRVKRQEERKKQENIGIESLVTAVRELEKERGPFEKDEHGASRGRAIGRHLLVAKMPILKRRDKFKILTISRIIVNGKAFKGSRSDPEGSIKDVGRLSSRKRRIEEDFDGYDLGDESVLAANLFAQGPLLEELDGMTLQLSASRLSWKDTPFPLRLLDCQRRMSSSDDNVAIDFGSWATENKPTARVLKDLGIEPRLPSWEDVKSLRKDIVSDYGGLNEPIRTQLENISHDARRWARHEFFYSDIDRAWYSMNVFAIDVASLGVSPSTKLTREEWIAVRRKIINRPRRFSRNFIARQLEKRDRFRNSVRKLWQNPDSDLDLSITDVPLPIHIGSTVLAYSERRRDIQRGTVIFHDEKRHGYFIRYGNEEEDSGYEFCADTDVAVFEEKSLSHTHHQDQATASVLTEIPSSLHPKLSTTRDCQVLTKADELLAWIDMRPKRSLTAALKSDVTDELALKEAAERETLVSLMAVLESATKRKAMILDILESYNSSGIPDISPDPGEAGSPQSRAQHYVWLLANLKSINKVINEASVYLKAMYGNAYQRSVGLDNDDTIPEKVESDIWKVCQSTADSPKSTLNWTSVLALDSGDVARSLAICSQEGINTDRVVPKMAKSGLVSSAASLLCAAEFCSLSALSATYSPSINEMEVVLDAELQDLLKMFGSPTDILQDDILDSLGADTSEAIRELSDSTVTFKRELLATCAARLLKP